MSDRHIPCYVINLRQDSERRERVRAVLARHDIAPVFFDAVDGRAMTRAQLDGHLNLPALAREYGTLTPGEVGCALSHIGVYREIVAAGHELAVVLEDDIDVIGHFGRLLDPGSAEFVGRAFPQDSPAMLQLTRVARGYRFSRRLLGRHHSVIRPASSVWLASGYVINRAGAQGLADSLYPVWTVADHWSRFEERGLIRLQVLTPPAVWASAHAGASSIGGARTPPVRARKTFQRRLRRLARDCLRPLLTRKL